MEKEKAKEILTEMSFAERLDFKVNPEFGFCYSEEKEALEVALKVFEENQHLTNRCAALTHGMLCMFCPIECESRSQAYRKSEEEAENDDLSESDKR